MRFAIIGFLAGIGVLQSQAALGSIWWWPLAVMPLPILWLIRPACRSGVPAALKVLVVLACAGMLGYAYASWRATERLADELPAEWESRDVEVTGIIANLPQRTDKSIRFEFEVESAAKPGARIPGYLALSWYDEVDRKRGETTPAPMLVPGERWTMTLRLRRLHGTQNPHGFDFEAWALERGIRATGYVRTKGINQRTVADVGRIDTTIHRARMALRESMMSSLEGKPFAGILVALAIGQQNAISAEQWREFWRTGTGHLMSISGLHITMMAGLLSWLVFRAWARIPFLASRVPTQRAAAIAGALAALGYSLIAGFSVPTQRTFFMLATVACFLASGRATSGSRILAAALLVVTLIDPWAVLSPGFWLSFGAVALIFLVTAHRTGKLGTWSSAIRTQAAVTIGLLPLTLILFQEVSLVSPLANAIAIPLVSLVVVPLTLAGAVWQMILGGGWLLTLAHACMAACYAVLRWMASFDHAVWQSHAPAAWAAALGLFAAVWLLMPRGMPGRWAAVFLMAPMLTVLPPRPAHGGFWVHVLDVGQGLSTVVRTARHTLVFDAGPSWNPDADSGNRIVVPFLRGEGIQTLDALIVSHADDDHSGGAASIIAARSPSWVMTSMPADAPQVAGAGEVMNCEAGDTWRWDGVDFDILHPTRADYARDGIKTNNMGCVLRVSTGTQSVLMTADIEKPSEQSILERFAGDPDTLKSTVLIVPHHGSRTSSTEAFLDAVAPKVAILPVGYRNRFRHPNAQVMQRYSDRRIPVHRTDASGAITLRVSPENALEVEHFRVQRKRYWVEAPDTSREASAP